MFHHHTYGIVIEQVDLSWQARAAAENAASAAMHLSGRVEECESDLAQRDMEVERLGSQLERERAQTAALARALGEASLDRKCAEESLLREAAAERDLAQAAAAAVEESLRLAMHEVEADWVAMVACTSRAAHEVQLSRDELLSLRPLLGNELPPGMGVPYAAGGAVSWEVAAAQRRLAAEALAQAAFNRTLTPDMELHLSSSLKQLAGRLDVLSHR